METSLVSIITPSYNQAQFIEDTLDSVRNQTYDDVEHIVMDGGSDDGTVEILEEYEQYDDYDLRWVSEPDGGQSDAINRGFERSDGDIVAWLNSDDVYFDVGVLRRVVEYFQRYSEDIIYGDLAYISKDSTIEAVDVRPPFDATKLPYRILIGQPATFFRGEVVAEERLRVDLHFSMDYEYWLRLARNYSFRHVEDVLAGFRAYEAQKSQDRKAMAAELREVFKNYEYPDRGSIKTLLDNGQVEAARLARAAVVTYDLHRELPPLAFDGRLLPLSTMVTNLGPGVGDVAKAFRRLRSEGQTG